MQPDCFLCWVFSALWTGGCSIAYVVVERNQEGITRHTFASMAASPGTCVAVAVAAVVVALVALAITCIVAKATEHKCVVCGSTFRKEEDLRRHKRTVHGNRRIYYRAY